VSLRPDVSHNDWIAADAQIVYFIHPAQTGKEFFFGKVRSVNQSFSEAVY